MFGWHSSSPFFESMFAPKAGSQAQSEPFVQQNPVLGGQSQASVSLSDMPGQVLPNHLGYSRPVSDFRFDGKTTDRADLMLRRARHMIDDGSAFESSVSVQAAFFGQSVVGSGLYVQAGQGEGKARTTLAFHIPSSDQATQASTATPPQQKITNLCDGRFVYRLHEDLVEGEHTLEFYDLQKIKNSTSDKTRKTSAAQRPGIPLAPGELMASGMAGLMQHLADEFRFTIVAEETGAERTRVLRGTWQPSRLQSLIEDHLGPDKLSDGLSWSLLPPNLPHAVELSLIRASEWELFPSRLTFYQFKSVEDRTMAQPVVVMEFQNPTTIQSVSDDQFVLRSENLEATDLTQQYLSKLRPDPDSSLR